MADTRDELAWARDDLAHARHAGEAYRRLRDEWKARAEAAEAKVARVDALAGEWQRLADRLGDSAVIYAEGAAWRLWEVLKEPRDAVLVPPLPPQFLAIQQPANRADEKPETD